jgi:hypothetical protein
VCMCCMYESYVVVCMSCMYELYIGVVCMSFISCICVYVSGTYVCKYVCMDVWMYGCMDV